MNLDVKFEPNLDDFIEEISPEYSLEPSLQKILNRHMEEFSIPSAEDIIYTSAEVIFSSFMEDFIDDFDRINIIEDYKVDDSLYTKFSKIINKTDGEAIEKLKSKAREFGTGGKISAETEIIEDLKVPPVTTEPLHAEIKEVAVKTEEIEIKPSVSEIDIPGIIYESLSEEFVEDFIKGELKPYDEEEAMGIGLGIEMDEEEEELEEETIPYEEILEKEIEPPEMETREIEVKESDLEKIEKAPVEEEVEEIKTEEVEEIKTAEVEEIKTAEVEEIKTEEVEEIKTEEVEEIKTEEVEEIKTEEVEEIKTEEVEEIKTEEVEEIKTAEPGKTFQEEDKKSEKVKEKIEEKEIEAEICIESGSIQEFKEREGTKGEAMPDIDKEIIKCKDTLKKNISKIDDVIKKYEKLYKECPSYPPLCCAIGSSYIKKGLIIEGVKEFMKTIDIKAFEGKDNFLKNLNG